MKSITHFSTLALAALFLVASPCLAESGWGNALAPDKGEKRQVSLADGSPVTRQSPLPDGYTRRTDGAIITRQGVTITLDGQVLNQNGQAIASNALPPGFHLQKDVLRTPDGLALKLPNERIEAGQTMNIDLAGSRGTSANAGTQNRQVDIATGQAQPGTDAPMQNGKNLAEQSQQVDIAIGQPGKQIQVQQGQQSARPGRVRITDLMPLTELDGSNSVPSIAVEQGTPAQQEAEEDEPQMPDRQVASQPQNAPLEDQTPEKTEPGQERQESEQAQAEKAGKPKKGDALRIPEDAADRQDYSFLEGCWRSEDIQAPTGPGMSSQPDAEEQRIPIPAQLCFDRNGQGQFTVEWKKMQCQAKIRARLQGNILKASNLAPHCPDGTDFEPYEFACQGTEEVTSCALHAMSGTQVKNSQGTFIKE